VFHRGAVQALAPDEPQVTPRLAALTRKQLIRPANGSAVVLKTKTACFASPNSIVVPFLAGDGTPSTSRSSSAVVPRFFVATPQATG